MADFIDLEGQKGYIPPDRTGIGLYRDAVRDLDIDQIKSLFKETAEVHGIGLPEDWFFRMYLRGAYETKDRDGTLGDLLYDVYYLDLREEWVPGKKEG